MTKQEAKELVEHRLARFINQNLDQEHVRIDLAHTVVKVLRELKGHRFTVVSDFHPFVEFAGVTFFPEGDPCYCYQQRAA